MAARKYELIAKRDKLIQEANAAADAVQGRALTTDETTAQADFDTKIAALSAEIALEERKSDRLKLMGSSAPREDGQRDVPGSGRQPRVDHVQPRADEDPRRGFSSHRDFLMAAMGAAGVRERADLDERLRPLAIMDKEDRQAAGEFALMLPVAFTPSGIHAAVGSDEQGNYSDRYGGFSVTPTILPGTLSVGAEADPTAGRTQAVPMQSPVVEIVARNDKNHTSSVSGGLTVSRRPETAAAAASRFELEKVTMKASSLFGLAYATEEILTDSPLSFAAIIASGFSAQFPHHILSEKLRGLGGSEFLGILTSLYSATASANLGPTVSVAEESSQAANTIKAENAINMRARCWGYGQAIWMANHDCYPQLAKMAVEIGTAGIVQIYQPSLQEDRPDMLLGRPIFYTEYCSTLGDPGDIILANWSQYLEGVYQPLQSAESVHVRFVNHEKAFKFWIRNAGAPWWRTALTPHKGAAALSPFVILDNRD